MRERETNHDGLLKRIIRHELSDESMLASDGHELLNILRLL